jgi:hypothetical protein
VEAGRELVAVKVDALGRGDGAELGSGRSAHARRIAGPDCLPERTVLLGMVAVGAK